LLNTRLLYKKGEKMSRASRTLRLLGRAIKILFVIFIFSVIAFLVWRAFLSTKIPENIEALKPDAELIEAYIDDPTLEGMFRQEQRSITSTEKNYGYFSIERATFIPSANQVQILVRYNNSTLRATERDFALSEALTREGTPYDVTLVAVRDLTPENKDDNLTGEGESTEEIRLFPKSVDAESTTFYNYRRYVFDFGELDMEKMLADGTLISVFTDIYYEGAINYTTEAYGTLCIYDYITSVEYISPEKDDIKAIESLIG